MKYLIDLKATTVYSLLMGISLSNIEMGLKILSTLIIIGYTVRRWYLLEKTKKE